MQKGKNTHSIPGPNSMTGRLWWVQQTMIRSIGFLALLEEEPSHCWCNHLFCTNPRCSSRCHIRKRDNGKVLPRLFQATSGCVTGMQPSFSWSVGAWSPQTFMVSTRPCRSMAVMSRKSFPTGKQYVLWLMYLQALQTFEGQVMSPLRLEIPIHWHYFQYTPALACLLGHDLWSWSA